MSYIKLKSKINNTSIPPTTYIKNTATQFSCIHIANINGKYGIVHAESNDILVPFEYDNISMAGFQLYLLIKNGKMGIVHIYCNFCEEHLAFKLLKLIPCEYDYISFPNNGESFVLMRKDYSETSSFDIYFPKANVVKKSFWRDEYNDRDYIVITGKDHLTQKVFNSYGKELLVIPAKNEMLPIYGVFETELGTVFIVLREDNSGELIILRKRKKKEYLNCPEEYADYYELTGRKTVYSFEKFIRPLFLSDNYRTFERKFINGYILERDGKPLVLNSFLKPIASEDADLVFIEESIFAVTETNKKFSVGLSLCGILYNPYDNI